MSKNAKILIIDDDSSIRLLVVRALEKFGFHVFDAAGAQAGLTVLEQNPDMDAIILDWMMPEMNGLNFLDALKLQKDPPPVLMMSAKSRKEDVLEAIKCGVKDYIAKPVQIGQLVIRLNSLLERFPREKSKDSSGTYLALEAHAAMDIADISHTGISFESTFSIPEGAIVFIESEEINQRLQLPPEFCFSVRVANSAPKGKRFKMGGQFVGLENEVIQRLKQACKSPTGFKI